MYRVYHRADQLLQKAVATSKERGPMGNDFHDNIAAIQALLLTFIDSRLLGSPFADRAALELALSEWPGFAYDRGVFRLEIWDELMVQETVIRTMRPGFGGPFVCAMVEEV